MESRKQILLLVEDNENVNAANRQLFERKGYAVQVARTIAEARLYMAGDGQVDMTLLDIDLPDGSGLSLLAELNELTGGAPVLVLSGRKDAKALAMQHGAQDYLSKPYRLDDLYRRVKALTKPDQTSVIKNHQTTGPVTPRICAAGYSGYPSIDSKKGG